MRVTRVHVGTAISKAISEAQRTTTTAYHKATTSQRKDALYRQVLLACALAPTDELGFFAPADVRNPLNILVQPKVYDIPNFQKHLNEFCAPERGTILHKAGFSHRFRYRFANPLMQPFVLIKGFADKWLPEEVLDIAAGQ
jgi:hypothetical protein